MSQNNQSPVTSKIIEGVAEIIVDYPPVNALSYWVRKGILDAIKMLEQNETVDAIIIRCEGKTFIAGADIKEFGKPPEEPFLPEVVNRIAACSKPVIASLFGTTLGGGLEVALACHYRVALENAKVGMPEVNLGLIPGAGGTQRLPRIVGIDKAIEMITGGRHYPATALKDSGLFDLLVSDNLVEASRNFARGAILPKIVESDLSSQLQQIDWALIKENVCKKARGASAPLKAVAMMESSLALPVAEGMKKERATFLELRGSIESAALRHAFSAEKMANKTPFKVEPLSVNKIGVIGGGNMGSGIATAFLSAGYEVIVIEQNSSACDAANSKIAGNIKGAVSRGKLSAQAADKQLALLTVSENKSDLADRDLVIEAVFEDLEIKKSLFAELNTICKADCLFATNTSYLDINQIAEASGRADNMIGMHFFSPANLMKLLEVVRAEKSSEQAIQTAMAVAKRLKKIAVLVGVCFGFAGNRMYTRYGREIQQMLLECGSVSPIDKAMKNFGMAMGPLAVQDLSGIDIGHSARSTQPFPQHDEGYFRAAAAMVEAGRLGRKTDAGFYRYVGGKAQPDPEADKIIQQTAASLGIEQRNLTVQEIQQRAMMALVSEGLALFQQGIVQRLSDIDVIWLNGYGFPRYKGGPIFMAQQLGVESINQSMDLLAEQYGEKIWPRLDWQLLGKD